MGILLPLVHSAPEELAPASAVEHMLMHKAVFGLRQARHPSGNISGLFTTVSSTAVRLCLRRHGKKLRPLFVLRVARGA